MERDTDKKAFDRAWSYLNYKPTAKWTAIICAALTGILTVKLVFLLWLFADLVVERGNVPSYRELSEYDQLRFQEFWDTRGENRKILMRNIGFPTSDLGTTESSLSGQPLEKQALVWRAYLFHIVRETVSRPAATLMIPAFREVPVLEQEGFFTYWEDVWKGASEDDRKLYFAGLGLADETKERLTAILDAKPTALTAVDRQILWLGALYYHFQIKSSDEGGDVHAARAIKEKLLAELDTGEGLPEDRTPRRWRTGA